MSSKRDILSTGTRHIFEVQGINRELIEKTLEMRALAYMANAKADLLTDTIFKVDSSKKELDLARIDLEKKVQERTKELEDTIKTQRVTEEKLTKIKNELEARVRERTSEIYKLSHAIEQAANIIMITDDIGNIEYTNPSFTQSTGYTSEEVIGKNPRILKSGEHTPEFYKALWCTIKSGNEWRGETHNKKKNGELYWESTYISPIKNDAGDIINFIAVKEDITENKKMEEALLQSEKLKSIGTITAGISHEFNNLLAIISGNVQLLEEDYKDDRVLTDALRTIMKATDDGTEISNNMLKFTKTSQEQDIKEFVSYDIMDLISHSIDFTKPRWRNEAQARGIDYKIGMESMKSVPSIMCNPTEIREIFVNIIKNALDAMPDGGDISFGTWSGNDTIFVSITDNGEGMSEDVKKNIFDPFFTTKGVDGAGLGMSMAYGIVARHGGKIEVSSVIGKGTTFTMQFPTTNKERSQIEAPRSKKETNIKNLHILVVDDERAICKILDKFLTSGGHNVKIVDNGADAINMIEGEVFDLVLCDLAMPNVFGIDVIKAANLLEKRPRIGIISGWEEKLKPLEREGMNVDFILKKPFKFSELSKHINDAFGVDSR
ncbi:MAG: PAS domain S-box protein [Candidatus Scalindua sp.]|nr:PAS domain S-box protein [Candidatus Scalindua sp.]MBT6225291.1 PAS domain S-box protein [Candidatus Scalindua sp.]